MVYNKSTKVSKTEHVFIEHERKPPHLLSSVDPMIIDEKEKAAMPAL